MTLDRRLREVTFTVTYERGVDPIADVLHEQPALQASRISVTLGSSSSVQLIRFTGPPAAVDRLQTALEECTFRPQLIGDGPCQATSTAYLLECTPRRRLWYVYADEIDDCPSIDTAVAAASGPGTISECNAHAGRERWRVLLRSDECVGDLFDLVDGTCCPGIDVELEHIGEATTWHGDAVVDSNLTGTQQQAIAEAAARGYYERPREITVGELAAELDVPESTLSYRLRMAESRLVKRYLERHAELEGPGPG
ncbi:helix-turn-helix domain-containing protein [Natrarchaeobaculum aegyptiacum]|uniref:Bacterio-opsin activator n=1 Tax=Natrarchaeobaculum aegyptiacum TaxID=745377 RepID=A0A2Z2HXB7_9EURY|nr:helix-turn-helix domain-containing protein [Natrarchaeobaculum aegyptiacum]ARS91881.1 bacterio-opsin activator [Natrarchaeobaculum aegyptiacum]